MSEIENPPAFPRDHRHLGHNGMTLRDWFAGQTLAMPAPGYWAGPGGGGLKNTPNAIADAMLAARVTTPPSKDPNNE